MEKDSIINDISHNSFEWKIPEVTTKHAHDSIEIDEFLRVLYRSQNE